MSAVLLSNINAFSLAKKISKFLNLEFSLIQTTRFNDGEISIECDLSCCRHLVLVVSMYPNVSESLQEILFATRKSKINGTKKITAIIPYFAYSRSENFEHVLYVLRSCGIDKIYVLDPHVYTNEMRDTYSLYKVSSVLDIVEQIPSFTKIDLLVAADQGREAFVEELSKVSNIPCIALQKIRMEDGSCTIKFVPDLTGQKVLLVDDIIDTGNTLLAGSVSLKNAGAEVHVFAAHALYGIKRYHDMLSSFIETLTTTDSVTNMSDIVPNNCRIISMASSLSKIVVSEL